ncbi:MAG: hypothetical protein ACYC9N_10990 [Thermoanaerobaculia bacterium]
MNGFAIVFRREFVERRNVIFTAIAASLIPVLIPLLPTVPADSRGELRLLLAGYVAATFAAAVAVAAGASLFSRDLADGRMSFLFSRPIGHLAIWSGKLAAGVTLSLATLALIAVPGLVMQPAQQVGWGIEASGWFLGFIFGTALLILLASNAVALVARSRRLIVVADFALLVIAVVVAWWIVSKVARLTPSLTPLLLTPPILAAILLLALLIASYVQTSTGRTDIGRTHRAFSFSFWPLVYAGLFLFAAYIAWIPRVDPDDIEAVHSVVDSGGSWMILEGEAAGRPSDFYEASLLVDTSDSDRFLRATPPWSGGVAFSRDGRRAAWFERDPDMTWAAPGARRRPERDLRLLLADLGDEPAVRETGFRAKDVMRIVLSDDGRRLAIWDGEQLSAIDLETLRSLGSVKVSAPERSIRMFFAGQDEIRVAGIESSTDNPDRPTALVWQAELQTWDIAERRLTRHATLADCRRVVADRTGDNLLTAGDRGISLYDGRTGRFRAQLLAIKDPASESASGSFLGDGRIAVAHSTAVDGTLAIFAAEGTKLQSIPLEGNRSFGVAEQLSSNEILVRSTDGTTEPRHHRTHIVDIRAGRIARTFDGMIPAGSWRRVAGTDPRELPARRGVALWNPSTGTLGRLDAITRNLTPILGPRG